VLAWLAQIVEIQEDDKKKKYTLVTLTDLERTITVNMKELRNKCKLRHAWARTIHTFQVRRLSVIGL